MRVILLDIDTLRPDHLGCYGYHRNTSPAIDEIAADSMRFNNYHCSDAPCLPSRAALVTGKFGIHTGIINHGGVACEPEHTGKDRFMFDQQIVNNLFFLFRSADMHTVSFSTFAERHTAYWFNSGFNEIYNVGKIGSETAEEVMEPALDWLKRNKDREDMFMHIHMWDPHFPYNAPMSYGNPFENDPLPKWLTEEVVEKNKSHIGPHSAHELNMFNDVEKKEKFPRTPGNVMDMAQARRVIDGYDTDVRYVDDQIRKLTDYLKAEGIYEDTAIIITADHGENLGELGIYSEHATADYITTRIPLIMKWPGMKTGVDEGLHYNIDLTRTIADLLGQKPIYDGDGESFIDTLKSGKDTGRDALIVSQCAHVCQRAVRFEDYMYIRTYHDGYHLFPKEMLFNIKEDPHEQVDLAKQLPEVCEKASRILMDWKENMMLTSRFDKDPMWIVLREGGPFNCSGRLGEYIERLEDTGRSEGAEELRKRHPNEVNNKKKIPVLPEAFAKNAP